MIVRIIKSDTCLKCKAYLPRLDKAGLQYETYDGLDEKNRANLDKWKIDDMPVVQIVSDDRQEVLYQFPHGTFSPQAINHMLDQLRSKK